MRRRPVRLHVKVIHYEERSPGRVRHPASLKISVQRKKGKGGKSGLKVYKKLLFVMIQGGGKRTVVCEGVKLLYYVLYWFQDLSLYDGRKSERKQQGEKYSRKGKVLSLNSFKKRKDWRKNHQLNPRSPVV